MNEYQQKQKETIATLEQQIQQNTLNFSTVAPVEDYENDARICLTGVHLPHDSLMKTIQEKISRPLKKLAPDAFFYPNDSLHITIKNIRTISDPPQFTKEDIEKAERVFSEVLSQHKKFNVYFYRLLLFSNNLALIGTTDEELDSIILGLDSALQDAGVPDNKQYMNEQYFFCNMTLARFPQVSKEFREKVEEVSSRISFVPYTVDSVTLLTGNAILQKRDVIKNWQLD